MINQNFLSPKMNKDLIDSELKSASTRSDFIIKRKVSKQKNKQKNLKVKL